VSFTPLDEIKTWQQTLPEDESATAEPDPIAGDEPSKFPYREELNTRVRLHHGYPWLLATQAVVNSTNERIECVDADAHALFSAAGRGLQAECSTLGGCRTGEAKITEGYDLAAEKVLHTVGPRYAVKYMTAAENALCHCYRSCLELAVHHKISSVAIGCVYTEAKGYPREDAAHVAIRTIRRFIEKWPQPEAVVVCTTGIDDEIYQRLMPLYFPRSLAEERAAISVLPKHTGNEHGEMDLEERTIRVGAFPGSSDMPEERIGVGPSTILFDNPENDQLDNAQNHFFTVMTDGPDNQRHRSKSDSGKDGPWWDSVAASVSSAVAPLPKSEHDEHVRFIERAKSVDVSDMAWMRILYRAGKDLAGRPVVVLVGAHLEVLNKTEDHDRFLLFAVKELEAVTLQNYNLVYFNSGCTLAGSPGLSFIRKLHAALGPKHKDNLKMLYIVHPTTVLRLAISTMVTFNFGVSNRVFSKASYIEKLSELYKYIPAEQLHVPEYVIDWEKDELGTA